MVFEVSSQTKPFYDSMKIFLNPKNHRVSSESSIIALADILMITYKVELEFIPMATLSTDGPYHRWIMSYH